MDYVKASSEVCKVEAREVLTLGVNHCIHHCNGVVINSLVAMIFKC